MADVIGTPGKALKVTITMTDGQTTSFVIPPGNDGKSAYELAKEAGYVGDEAQWLADLHGDKGDKGDKGDAGTNGTDGTALSIEGSVDETATLPPVINYDIGACFFKGTVLYTRSKSAPTQWSMLVDLKSTLEDAPSDGICYVRQNGIWVQQGAFDVGIAASTGEVNATAHQLFTLDGTKDNTVTFTNLPAGRATVIALVFHGKGGSITWPDNLAWSQNDIPKLADTRTVISILWDGETLTGTTALTV